MKSNNFNNECRMTKEGIMSQSKFNLMSCVQCYNLLGYVFPNFEPKLNTESNTFYSDELGRELSPKYDMKLFQNSMRDIEFSKWNDCCREAENCCNFMKSI